MIRLLTALLFASFDVAAEVTLTPLNNNTPADADDVMGNFTALKNEIESLPRPPSDCSTNQIIKWNGSAWVCANDLTSVGWWRVDSWSGQDPVDLACANAFDSTSRNVKFYFPDALMCRSTIYDFSVMGIQFYQGCSVALEENSGSISFRRLEANNISYFTENVAVGEPAKFVLSCPDEAAW